MSEPIPVISIWQPYASLIIAEHKLIETRAIPAPSTVVGKRIGIAATKLIVAHQRAAIQNRSFRKWIKFVGMDKFVLGRDYPMGCILGTALVERSEVMTKTMIRKADLKEKAFGWWQPGRHAWFLKDIEPFDQPIPARGGQGIWYYHGEIPQGRAA